MSNMLSDGCILSPQSQISRVHILYKRIDPEAKEGFWEKQTALQLKSANAH